MTLASARPGLMEENPERPGKRPKAALREWVGWDKSPGHSPKAVLFPLRVLVQIEIPFSCIILQLISWFIFTDLDLHWP